MPHNIAKAIVVGGGPAGLMAAERLAIAGLAVDIYDRMPSLGRKFLLAGRGGLNLTHSEPLVEFGQRYDAPDWIAPHLSAFTPNMLRQWAAELGEPTFIGSSGRVFPQSFKASPLLRAWLQRLDGLGVRFFLRHRLTALEPGCAKFVDGHGLPVSAKADAIVLAMGGASWGRMGSDGAWVPMLQSHNVGVAPLRPANCGLEVRWSYFFREHFAGAPLKTIRLTHGETSLRGSATITARGLEGGVVYALSAAIRDQVEKDGHTLLKLDLRPDVSLPVLTSRLARPRGKVSIGNFLRKAGGLDAVGAGLVQEVSRAGRGTLSGDGAALAQCIKSLPLQIWSVSDIERAISTAGGILRAECDSGLMLHRMPGVFAAGEMLDWEAPTGGYLLQGCFATGYVAGTAAAVWALRNGG